MFFFYSVLLPSIVKGEDNLHRSLEHTVSEVQLIFEQAFSKLLPNIYSL